MREAALPFVAFLGACLPTTTGTGVEDTDSTESSAGHEETESGPTETGIGETTGEVPDGDSGTAETDAEPDPLADEAYTEEINFLTYAMVAPSTIVVHVFDENAANLALFEFSIVEKAAGPRLLLSAEFPDMDAKWLMRSDQAEQVTAVISLNEAPAIRARAQAVRNAMEGSGDLYGCAARVAEAVVDCASFVIPESCPSAFVQTYCACRLYVFDVDKLSCL